MTKASEPAKPTLEYSYSSGVMVPVDQHLGLTKREYFAAMAMQGILAYMDEPIEAKFDDCAKYAVRHAEALIEELNRKEEQ